MNKKIYYGTENPTTFTFMEFGEIDTITSMKKIWGFKMHQKAYDWFMLSRYANDILAFNAMKKILGKSSGQDIIDYYNAEVHHEDEMSLHLAQNIAMIVTQNKPVLSSPSFYELGQTLFGCIEGMELYQDILNHLSIDCPQIDFKNIEWKGVDISNMFNELSQIFHQGYKVDTMLYQSELPEQMDVFFSKGITLLYAVRDMEDLFYTIKKGRIAVFDYSFALGKQFDTTIGSGKTVRYLELNSFLNELKNHDEKLYVKKSNSRIIKETNRLWVDCIFGEQSICEDYIKLDVRLRKEIANKLSTLNGSSRFLNNDNSPEWMTIEEII
jgi:hypothetical protein